MEFFCVAGGPLGRFVSPHSSLRLLLLVTAQILLVSGQSQVGVSLRFRGAALPNDSIVDIDDVMYTEPGSGPFSDLPSNTNPRDEAVLCVTDLVDCCASPRTVRGNWYLPDGTRVEVDPGNGPRSFYVNRGPNEVINGQTVYGSVRLYRRLTPIQNGRFRCELPSAADSSVNQIRYVNILSFGIRFDGDHVTFSPSTGSTVTTAGQRDYTLTCSVTLFELDRIISRSDVPSLNFQWSFDGSTSLPSGVTAMPTVMSSSNSTSETYTSTLQFSPLSQSHAGMYTCRLGPGRLENNVMVTVNAPPITVSVTANLNTPLMVGQTGSTLTCGVSGADGLTPMTTYLWTRNGGREVSRSSSLPLSPVRLSDAGNYTCRATVNSNLLTNGITMSANRIVMVQVPAPPSVTVSSSTGNTIILNNTAINVNCEVDFGQGVSESELSLLIVEAQLFRDGTPLMLDDPTMSGSSLVFGSEISSFNDSNVGNYNCIATVRPAMSSQFLTGTGQGTSPLVILTIGILPTREDARIPPTQSHENATTIGCYSGVDIAIAVVVSTLIECLLAAPVITAVMVICWKRNQRKPSQYKSTSDAIATQSGEVYPGEDVYEDPDRTAVTTTPREFKLTECPAYVTTTTSSPQPTTEAQLQSGYYEL